MCGVSVRLFMCGACCAVFVCCACVCSTDFMILDEVLRSKFWYTAVPKLPSKKVCVRVCVCVWCVCVCVWCVCVCVCVYVCACLRKCLSVNSRRVFVCVCMRVCGERASERERFFLASLLPSSTI